MTGSEWVNPPQKKLKGSTILVVMAKIDGEYVQN